MYQRNGARETKDNGQRDGGEAQQLLLGQVHHRYTRKQVQLQRIGLPQPLRPALYGYEPNHHEALSVNAVKKHL